MTASHPGEIIRQDRDTPLPPPPPSSFAERSCRTFEHDLGQRQGSLRAAPFRAQVGAGAQLLHRGARRSPPQVREPFRRRVAAVPEDLEHEALERLGAPERAVASCGQETGHQLRRRGRGVRPHGLAECVMPVQVSREVSEPRGVVQESVERSGDGFPILAPGGFLGEGAGIVQHPLLEISSDEGWR